MLNVLDLQGGKLAQQSISHTFGVMDLYRDFDTSKPDQHHLEKELSKLESRAGETLAKVRQAFDSGKQEVELIRGEKDDLRKFLFIMLYRNRNFQARFNVTLEEYKEIDRAPMLAYMKEKNFTRPIDVWFANIKAILDLKIDVDMTWCENITSQVYPPDAHWFYKYMQMSFLTFCTPQDPLDEFLLTQNAYSIFEGQNNALSWTDFHNFAPVSPRLIIVLRSCLLPSNIPEDDSDILAIRQSFQVAHPNVGKSILEDLPIAKAMNNYTRIVDGKLERLPTKIRPENHKFRFQFFPISTAHAQKINTIMLEEAIETAAVVYKNPQALRRALDAYFEDPGFKHLINLPPEHYELGRRFVDMRVPGAETVAKWSDTCGRVPYLKDLEKIARQLGSLKEAKYNTHDLLNMKRASNESSLFQRCCTKLGEPGAI